MDLRQSSVGFAGMIGPTTPTETSVLPETDVRGVIRKRRNGVDEITSAGLQKRSVRILGSIRRSTERLVQMFCSETNGAVVLNSSFLFISSL